MRRQDKYKNMEQASLMLENLYLKSKGLLKEGDTQDKKDKWDNIWQELGENNKSFDYTRGSVWSFGGLFFYFDKNDGKLKLEEQKLSDWRDDPDKAKKILDDYVTRLKTEFGDKLNLTVGPNYSMEIEIQ